MLDFRSHRVLGSSPLEVGKETPLSIASRAPVGINKVAGDVCHWACQNLMPLVIVQVMGGVVGLSQVNGFTLNVDGK